MYGKVSHFQFLQFYCHVHVSHSLHSNGCLLVAAETHQENVMPGEIPDAPTQSPEPKNYSTTIGESSVPAAPATYDPANYNPEPLGDDAGPGPQGASASEPQPESYGAGLYEKQ